MSHSPLRILIVEDSATDTELALRELARADMAIESQRVETAGDYHRALETFKPQIVLSDFSMPAFSGMQALTISREHFPHIPFIFVSGTIGEESAIHALKNGATDYVLKSNLLRLPSAVEKAIEGVRERAEQLRIQSDLRENRDRLEEIMSSLREVAWSIAASSRQLIYISSSISDLYELTGADFLQSGMPWGGLIHPSDQARAAKEWAQASASGCFEYEHRVMLPGRGIRWMHNRGKCVTDTMGQPVRIDGISHDITDRREQYEKTTRVSRILIKVFRQFISGRRNHVSSRLVSLLSRGLENSVGRLPHEELSGRELQVLLLIGNGRSGKQIAGDLDISINTVNTHRARILKKMDMRSNAALIRYAVEHGLVE